MKLAMCRVRVFVPLFPLALGACAHPVSPSFTLLGALFPAWMVCALIGIFAAIAARVLMVGLKLSGVLPFQLLVCVSIGMIIALLVWLGWFGQ